MSVIAVRKSRVQNAEAKENEWKNTHNIYLQTKADTLASRKSALKHTENQ